MLSITECTFLFVLLNLLLSPKLGNRLENSLFKRLKNAFSESIVSNSPTILIVLIVITLILELIKNLSNFNNLDFLSTVPIDILRILGIFLSVYGVILIGIEKN
jgi:hypothetical protein